MEKKLFRAEVKKQLYLRGWSYAQLAEALGYTTNSMRVIINDDKRLNDKKMQIIASVLDIKL